MDADRNKQPLGHFEFKKSLWRRLWDWLRGRKSRYVVYDRFEDNNFPW